jgi:DNA-binding PadR family transcriptional regulator
VTDHELEGLLPLTPTTFYILLALAKGPTHGYAVAQDVEELTDGRIVMGPGTLYGSLQRMLGSGVIEETANPGESGLHSQRRRYYHMSSLGAAALQAESERLLRAVNAARERLGT